MLPPLAPEPMAPPAAASGDSTLSRQDWPPTLRECVLLRTLLTLPRARRPRSLVAEAEAPSVGSDDFNSDAGSLALDAATAPEAAPAPAPVRRQPTRPPSLPTQMLD